MKNFYEVSYTGLWLGGRAIVYASNELEAKQLVAADKTTACFRDVTVRQLKVENDASTVLYNDNGDY